MSGHLKNLLNAQLANHDQRHETLVSDLPDVLSEPVPIAFSTEDKITAFFRILSFLRNPHVADRLAFWKGYAESGAILQTWYCLTTPLIQRAHEINGTTSRIAILTKDHRVSELHGVLLMRFSHFVVAEWSHLGRCRFWHTKNPYAPKLFSWSYRRDELLQFPDRIQQHYFSSEGRWQKDASRWMAEVITRLPRE